MGKFNGLVMKFITLQQEYTYMTMTNDEQAREIVRTLKESHPLTKEEADELVHHYSVVMESPRTGVNFGMKSQIQAFQELSGGNDSIFKVLISIFGADFRQILDGYKAKFHRPPTASELIWIAGEHAHRDPRDIVDEIRKDIEERGEDAVVHDAMADLSKHYGI